MRITFYSDSRDKRTNTNQAINWQELCQLLTEHKERNGKEGLGFSLVTYDDAPCQCPDTKEVCPKADGHAINANVLETHALCFDLDKDFAGDTLTQQGAIDTLSAVKALGVAAVAYTSHNFTPPDKGAWRLVVALSRPVRRSEFRTLWASALTHLGIPSGIKSDFPARFWYLPSCEPGAPRCHVILPGEPLDVDALLANAPVETQPDKLSETPTGPASNFPKASEKLLKHVSQQLHNHGQAIAGKNGSTHTFIAANILLNDYALGYDEAWPMFSAWNVRNEPPWDEAELASRLNMDYADTPYGQARHVHEFVSRLDAPPNDTVPGTFAHTLETVRDTLKVKLNTDIEHVDKSPMFMSAKELMEKDFPTTPWLVRGLMTQGGVGVVGGEPKTFKTWLAVEIAIAVANGDKAFGEFPAEKGSVAYYFAEDMEVSVQNRLRGLCKRRGSVPDNLHLQPRGRDLDICNDESLAVLIASASQIDDLKLLVLDPFRDIHTAAEDSSDEMSKVMRRLRTIGNMLDCTVLFVHHTGKSNADTSTRRPGQRLRGSSAVHGGTDNGLYLSGTSGDLKTEFTNRVFCEVKGALGAGHFNLTLKITDGADGTAIDTEWTMSQGDAESVEDLNDVVRAIGSEIAHANLSPGRKDLITHVKGTMNALDKNLANAQTTGHIRKNVTDTGVFKGWELTTKGNTLYEELTR